MTARFFIHSFWFIGCHGFGFLGNIGGGRVLFEVCSGCGSELEDVSEDGEGNEEEAGGGRDESGEDVGETGRGRDKVGGHAERNEEGECSGTLQVKRESYTYKDRGKRKH